MVDKKFHYRWDFIGLSTDEKPTPENCEKVVNGSTFYCSDNSKLYVFYKDTWYERKPLGGGGGTNDYNDLSNLPKINGVELKGNKTSSDLHIEGASYTAGTGIDITNNVISADIATATEVENICNQVFGS